MKASLATAPISAHRDSIGSFETNIRQGTPSVVVARNGVPYNNHRRDPLGSLTYLVEVRLIVGSMYSGIGGVRRTTAIAGLWTMKSCLKQ